jgi:hypothetical protein
MSTPYAKIQLELMLMAVRLGIRGLPAQVSLGSMRGGGIGNLVHWSHATMIDPTRSVLCIVKSNSRNLTTWQVLLPPTKYSHGASTISSFCLKPNSFFKTILVGDAEKLLATKRNTAGSHSGGGGGGGDSREKEQLQSICIY